MNHISINYESNMILKRIIFVLKMNQK